VFSSSRLGSSCTVLLQAPLPAGADATRRCVRCSPPLWPLPAVRAPHGLAASGGTGRGVRRGRPPGRAGFLRPGAGAGGRAAGARAPRSGPGGRARHACGSHGGLCWRAAPGAWEEVQGVGQARPGGQAAHGFPRLAAARGARRVAWPGCRSPGAAGRAAPRAPPRQLEEPKGVRLPREEETIEAMISARLQADGLEPPPADRHPGDGGPSAEARGQAKRPADAAQPREGPPEAEEAEEVAPVKNVFQVRRERAAKARRTESGRLVLASGRRSWTNNGVVHLLRSAVAGDPHRRWTRKVVARHTGVFFHDDAPEVFGRVEDTSAVPASVPRVGAEEAIVTVAVCNASGCKEQEFDVLASQTLCELRDAFYFVSDWMFDGPTRLGSSCFFIDGLFYVDRRNPNHVDYSVEIIEWLKETRDSNFLRSQTALSMDVRLCDLGHIPFGEVCVYIHQGNIEHNIYFTGTRLVHPRDDCPFSEAYPLLTFMRRYVKRRCFACLQHLAIWVVLDSTRCPYNPSFWCAQCFRRFFQDAEGQFIPPVDYRVFPYLHDES
ncbi:unnamed protein product, partial [Prorocentrum cordatum]